MEFLLERMTPGKNEWHLSVTVESTSREDMRVIRLENKVVRMRFDLI